MSSSIDDDLDKELADAFDSPPEPDFDAWRRQHPQAVTWLDPRRMAALVRRRRMMTRAVKIAAAAAVLVCVWAGVSHFADRGGGSIAFADVLEQVERAKTMTWKTTLYIRVTSKDGKRTWITTETVRESYRAPGLYREERLDKHGQIRYVTITDAVHRKGLQLIPARKEATILEPTSPHRNPRGPFVGLEKRIKEDNLEWVGKKKTAGGEANVFRTAFRDEANNKDWSYDFWIDAKTKRLVAVQVPGADIYDPEKDPARRNPAEEAWGRRTGVCHAHRDITFDAELDESLFELEPPKGYTVQRRPRSQVSVTEKEMLEYLGILAEYNDKVFPDQVSPFVFPSDRINKTWAKREKDRSAAEQKLLEAQMHYMMANLNEMPIAHFIRNRAVEKSFRYLGKGVKLGQTDRIVCWYRLKGSKTYRVVYGDLSVKDVASESLPLR